MIGKNNPLNIRYNARSHWIGQTGSTRGFSDFKEERFCYRAGAYLLMRSYRWAGIRTIRDCIYRWAPPKENATESYIRIVCGLTGFSPDYVLSSRKDVARLLAAMVIMEQGMPTSKRKEWMVTQTEIIAQWLDEFNLNFIK